jgi:hypothetical protein
MVYLAKNEQIFYENSLHILAHRACYIKLFTRLLANVFLTGGLYRKTLRIRNLRKMDIFQSKLVSVFGLGQTH